MLEIILQQNIMQGSIIKDIMERNGNNCFVCKILDGGPDILMGGRTK